MKVHRTITNVNPFPRKRACLSVLTLTLAILTACSQREVLDDVAVASMPKSQMQATNFLQLNYDKPGTFVTVQRYLVPGKYTIVCYFSPYDGASVSLLPRLAKLTRVRTDIAVRTVNVNRPEIQGIDWQSPILANSRIQKLPYFQIYDSSQGLRAQARPAYEGVMQWLQAVPN